MSGKGEARAAMEAAVLAVCVTGNDHIKAVVKERVTDMGVGMFVYRQGAYFPV